jgi:putative transcriptional regulator
VAAAFTSLQGRLLIAGPSLLDPNFFRTVVLIAEHTPLGAMGVVLNRPTPLRVADAVPVLADVVEGEAFVHLGGPVQPEAVIALGEFRDPTQAAALILDDLGFLPGDADPATVSDDLRRARVFSGYAGWDAEQLEAELAQDAWIVEPAQVDDVFADAAELWSRVLERKGGTYRLLARMPVDPSVN